MTEGKDSRETVAVSTNDNDEDAHAQRQRALLHNAPTAPLREPTPGERLMTFEHGQDDLLPQGFVATQTFPATTA